MSDIQLFVNQRIYSGWKSATIIRSLDAISGKFEVDTVDVWKANAQRWTIFPGNECSLKLNDIPQITGFVGKAAPHYDPEGHGIKITGRDKTGDLVDSSIIIKGSELRGLKLDAIARAVAKPYGINVVVDTGVDVGAVFPVHAVLPGETAWEYIERAAKQRFMVFTTDGLGNLVISDIGKTRAFDSLAEGKNIKSAEGDYDHSERFSDYIVKGSAPVANDGWDDAKTNVEQRATDPNVKRYRPKIIIAETAASDGSASNRAALEAATRAGKSTKATVTVRGWTQSNGILWPVNAMVAVQSPLLSLDTDMLISETKFTIDDKGETTELTLTRPDAYLLGQGKVKNKKSKNNALSGDPWETFGK